MVVPMRKTFSMFLGLALLGLALPAGLARAQTLSPVNQVSNFDNIIWGNLGFAAVEGHPSGNSVTIYSATGADTLNPSKDFPYVSLLGPDGAPLGTPVQIDLPCPLNYCFSFDVVHNPVSGGWTAFIAKNRGTPNGLYSQSIGADGTLDGSLVTIDEDTQQRPSVTAVWVPSTNGFLVASHMQNVTPISASSTRQWVTYTVTAAGARITGPTVVGDSDTVAAANGSAAYSPTSNVALLVEVGKLVSGDNNNVIGQLVTGSGTRVGTGFRLVPDDEAWTAAGAGVAWNAAADEFLVTWSSHNNNDCSTATTFCGVVAQRVSTTGALLGDRIVMISKDVYDSSLRYGRPSMVSAGSSGEYAVTWHYGPNWDAGQSIYMQRLASDGSLIDTEPVDVSEMFGREDSAHQRPAISYNGKDGAYIVVWQYVPDITVVVGGYSRHENIASRSVTAPVDSTQPELPTTGNSTTLLLSALVLSLIGLVATGHRRIRRA